MNRYHEITVKMAVLENREHFWDNTNCAMDLPFLIHSVTHSEESGSFIDCGYCLDQWNNNFEVGDIDHILR